MGGGSRGLCDLTDNVLNSPKACDNPITVDMTQVFSSFAGEDARDGGTFEYSADWPVNRNFFQGPVPQMSLFWSN